MNIPTVQGVVAVGVDGSPEATEAARYAVDLATSRGRDLLLVSASQLPYGLTLTEDLITEMRLGADRVVDEVVAELRIPADLRVHRLVELASPVTLLVRVAQTAGVLVIGRHHVNLADQLLTGPVASAVAAGAACPVVVVPPRWDRPGRRPSSVVVALDGETASTAALDFAFDEAELRRSEVVALHAESWSESAFETADRANLEEVLAGHRQDHPDVPVTTVLVTGKPAETIVGQSFAADLMVVGRPHRHHLGSWTRSVARAVMAETHCPLVIVPEAKASNGSGSAESLAGAARG